MIMTSSSLSSSSSSTSSSPEALLPSNLDHLADPAVGHRRSLHPDLDPDPGNEGQFIFGILVFPVFSVIHVASFITRSIPSHDVEKKTRRSDIGIFSLAGAILHSYIYNVSVMSCFLGKGNLNCKRFRQAKCVIISKSINRHKISNH